MSRQPLVQAQPVLAWVPMLLGEARLLVPILRTQASMHPSSTQPPVHCL